MSGDLGDFVGKWIELEIEMQKLGRDVKGGKRWNEAAMRILSFYFWARVCDLCNRCRVLMRKLQMREMFLYKVFIGINSDLDVFLVGKN